MEQVTMVNNEKLLQIRQEMTPLIEMANSLSVETVEDYEKISELIKKADERKKFVVEYFKKMKDLAHQAHKKACDMEKVELVPMVMFRNIVDPKVKTYLWNEEQKRQVAQRKADEEARAAQKKLDDDAEKLAQKAEKRGDTDVATAIRNTVPTVTAPVVVKTIPKTGIGMTSRLKVRLLDIKKVQRRTLEELVQTMDDYPSLNAYVQKTKGKIAIPGFEIYQDTSLSVRTR